MQLTFYGVRGSIPTPGAEYVRYGGNTACVHISLEDGTDIVVDAGTGIRNLGNKLIKKHTPIHLLLTHNHWDHIQGFPFFKPIYQKDRKIIITPGQTTPYEPDQILQQMQGSVFPVPASALVSDISFQQFPEETNTWTLGTASISRLAINHPGKGNAFSIIENGKKIVYMTDNELYPPYKKENDFLSFVTFCQNADLLIHDAQYNAADMPAKLGWGHSVAEEAVKLAIAADVKQLALYSHDPERTDEAIDRLVEHCQSVILTAQCNLLVFAAAEGQSEHF
ncbi:MBL fold metallo-hydrolase [Alteromonas ponticola]|uniref:MBL fold metallo-hydrolase n=1 Tax=Alteromonas ponticola TaxID=2720613 RepID=A0ABX1QYR3_9ALTE|nr:MBL fold metallo-hydrolase [Alteromonas ponticola]NMH58989.1 MBL fold metallo-hydrolase [Alteromonas ponticola]